MTIAGGLIAADAAMAQAPCVTQNMAVPPNANTSDKAAPFFIDTTGLDFKTAPPTRDPMNPNYPKATELADGTLGGGNQIAHATPFTDKASPRTCSSVSRSNLAT